jgi:NAD(P)-dependent dehydrogenase (short-subunit alcohol dehydrogenase family)
MVNRNIILIGGHTGIGKSTLELLIDSGAHVYTASRRDVGGASSAFKHIQIDVTAESFNINAIPEEVHGLVYFPGSITLKPFRTIKIEQFLADFEINVLGAVRVLQNILPRLVTGASVVLFSTVALQRGMPFHSSVGAAKGAVEGLIKSLAAEWAPKIRINGIAPSLTDTDMAAKLLNTDQKRTAGAERHPLKRIGRPRDIAHAVHFLLSDQSSWMTGQIVHIDGGLSVI